MLTSDRVRPAPGGVRRRCVRLPWRPGPSGRPRYPRCLRVRTPVRARERDALSGRVSVAGRRGGRRPPGAGRLRHGWGFGSRPHRTRRTDGRVGGLSLRRFRGPCPPCHVTAGQAADQGRAVSDRRRRGTGRGRRPGVARGLRPEHAEAEPGLRSLAVLGGWRDGHRR